MIKRIFQQIGASENSILKFIAQVLRWPVQNAQLQLLKVHKDKDVIDLVRIIQKEGGSLM